jgi:predicted metalloprotease
MRFNPKARLDTSRVRSGGGAGGGRGGGPGGGGMRVPLPAGTRAGGGAGLLVIIVVILLLKACGGVDLTGAVAGGGLGGYTTSRFQGDTAAYQSCKSGEDANARPDTCGIVAVENSLVDYWRKTLPQQSPKATFKPETAIVTFNGSTSTGCGQASSAMGPFYCPTDQTIYFDPSFFHDILQQQLHGPSGAFVEPYVIAHEFGHHVQNLLGTMRKVKTQQGPNSDSVRLELQADCYAGVWAANAKTPEGQPVMEQGDIEEGMRAAEAIGDDTLQKETQGRVVPDSFTHGTSAQRMNALRTGFQSGNIDACQSL